MNPDDFTLAAMSGGPDVILAGVRRIGSAQFHSTAAAENAALQAAHAHAMSYAYARILPELEAIRDSHALAEGERPEQADEWDSALDDKVEALFEPFAGKASVNWLGINTVDTRLHMPGEAEKIARGFAADLWNTATFDKDSRDILIECGVFPSDLKPYISASAPTEKLPTTPVVEHKEAETMHINQVCAELSEYGEMADLFSDMNAYAENLDLASDNDDVLALGAIERLGGTREHVDALRAYRKENGGAEAIKDLAVVIETWDGSLPTGEEDAPLPPPPPPAALPADPGQTYSPEASPPVPDFPLPPPAPPPAAPPGVVVTDSPGKPGRKARAPADPNTPGAVPVSVLKVLKERTALKDVDLAAALGVSRATFNNYVNGKVAFVADNAQLMTLGRIITEHVQTLAAAMEELPDQT